MWERIVHVEDVDVAYRVSSWWRGVWVVRMGSSKGDMLMCIAFCVIYLFKSKFLTN